jgi:hypothetical protein
LKQLRPVGVVLRVLRRLVCLQELPHNLSVAVSQKASLVSWPKEWLYLLEANINGPDDAIAKRLDSRMKHGVLLAVDVIIPHTLIRLLKRRRVRLAKRGTDKAFAARSFKQ